ncbi:MAG TPA: PBP1A family penicillin-binding protein [Candidatus Bipolaricaulota bacterium]|nr:PBP1A family penicillin-binding protein [Candidatus Bipolaricaulota bacterium]
MPIPYIKSKSTLDRQPKKRGKFDYKLWLRRLILAGIFCFVIGVICLIGAFAWFSRDLPDPNKIMERDIAQSTKIYDRTGQTVLYEVHGEEKRTLVPIEEIPDTVKWATIAVEDKDFYKHHGFSYTGVLRAVIFGGSRGGGSTITQQFVKNAILTSEKTYTRKIKELILSYQMEKKFTKDQILQMYLNEIPYGSVSYGIAAASQTFLGRDVRDLTLAESALLASLPQRPSYYSPYGSNQDELINRQHFVLDKMAEQGYITQEQADEAKKEEISFQQKSESIIAPHFVMYVKELLSEKYGEKTLEEGLKVITTLDLDKQLIAEKAVTEGVEARGEQYGFSNAALISLDPKTGQILAMVGSKDFFDDSIDGQVNVTTRPRQPGSSLKPMVYSALFEKGFSPESILFDVVTTFSTGGKPYTPHNYDNAERGPVSIRKALAGSLNTTAVKALYLSGVDNVINLLEKFGYTSFQDRSRFGLALVLGGGEVELLEHANAYAVYANEGKYVPSVAILRIEDNGGQLIEEFEDPDPRDVIDPNISRMISSVLSDNEARAYVFGTQNPLTLGGRPVAAKTGTTNDYRDAWTMGYTPNLVAGVWVGNNDNSEMKRGAAGGVVAAPIWHAYMAEAVKDLPMESFAGYNKPKTDKAILNGSYTAEKTEKIDKFSGKLATEYTPASAIEEKTFMEVHNILHYIRKEDPLGSAPTENNFDPEYKNWEAAVQAWLDKASEKAKAEGKELEFAKAPTEYDDVHLPELKPTVRFTSPQSGQDITDLNLSAQIFANAPRGIRRVEYYLDNDYIFTAGSAPYSLYYQIKSDTVNGYHNLKAIAYDDVDNFAETSIDINIKADRPAPSMTWMFPAVGGDYSIDNFPLVVKGRLTDLSQTKEVKFFYDSTEIGSVQNPDSKTVFVSWTDFPGSGSYAISAQIIDKAGQTHATSAIPITLR